MNMIRYLAQEVTTRSNHAGLKLRIGFLVEGKKATLTMCANCGISLALPS
jgi:hypothetical protein